MTEIAVSFSCSWRVSSVTDAIQTPSNSNASSSLVSSGSSSVVASGSSPVVASGSDGGFDPGANETFDSEVKLLDDVVVDARLTSPATSASSEFPAPLRC